MPAPRADACIDVAPEAAIEVTRRRLVIGITFGAAAWTAGADAWPAAAAATHWPSGPLHFTVAYPPGGISDEVMRLLADKLSARLQVPVLVEHRPGAGGALAMDRLARAAPDGHALCFSAVTALTLVPHVTAVRYDPLRDIAPVAPVMATPVLVAGTPALAERRFDAVIALARRRPGRLRWATSGVGTTGHRVLERVREHFGVDIAHIPYKGGGAQVTDALAGQFELLSTNVAPAQLQHVRDGRLSALAVGAPRRLAVLPDVPTLAEAGAERANLVSLFGVFAPGGMPAALAERINAEVQAAMAEPDLRARLLRAGNEPAGGSAREFAERVAREWADNRGDAKR